MSLHERVSGFIEAGSAFSAAPSMDAMVATRATPKAKPDGPFCRFCLSPLRHTFADLGMSPLSNAYLKREQLNCFERFYPLHAYVCGTCFLVQVEAFESPDRIFNDYAYFSSVLRQLARTRSKLRGRGDRTFRSDCEQLRRRSRLQ